MSKKAKGFYARAVPSINRETCTDCGLCTGVCGGEPLVLRGDRVEIDSEAVMGCLGCGQCVAICPNGSITVSGRGLSPGDVIDLPPRSSKATADQLEALLLPRRSIRHYKDQEVSRELVDRIISVATTAPMGIPPSQVGIVVFHGRAKVKAFSDDVLTSIRRMMKMMTPVTMAFFRPFIKKADYEAYKEFLMPLGKVIENEMANGRDALLYGAPVALLFHSSPYADPADSTIAATYAMIAAESLGLGTCLIGMVAPFMGRDKKLMEKYKIPKGDKLNIVLILGSPGVDFKHGIRRRLASVAFA